MTEASQPLLDQFEQAVFDPQKQLFSTAIALLHQILANHEKLGGDVDNSYRTHFYTRLAQAISALMLDETFELDLPRYQLLCGSHFVLATVFACSPLQTSDHVIARLANIQDINNLRFRNLSILMKCLLCYSLDSQFNLNLQTLGESYPDVVAPVLLGHLGCDLLSRPLIEHKINQLLSQSWPVFSKVQPGLPMVVSTSAAWMNCSYASTPQKHLIKHDLNKMIRNGLKAQGIQVDQLVTDVVTNSKPKLLIPIELMQSNHAMYRCFSRVIQKLQGRFEITGLAPQNCIDTEAEKIFPKLIKFDPAQTITNLKPLLEQIKSFAPDMIYYPSLGMANYTLMLANLRLAPIQCFTLGHPASSYIDTIDYAILQQQDFTVTDIYSEKVILTGNDTSPTINQALDHIKQPTTRENPDTINIAVTSKHMKINHRFLMTCREISDMAERPVEYHFFPGATGYLFEFIRHEILRLLPNSIIYPTTDYSTYIHNMDQCDIRFGTFPFGGANTNMDCFSLGIPFVVLDGDQPHSHSDTAQIRQADLPDWLMADSREAYAQAALRLINNNDERLSISHQMMQLYQHDFFYKASTDENIVFDKTLYWLYQNHDKIKQSEQRLWTLQDQDIELEN